MPQVAVLSHHQPAWAKASTFVLKQIADLLVQRMAAERISARVIRMMPPGSIFLPALQAANIGIRYIPGILPPIEPGNNRVVNAKRLSAADRLRQQFLLDEARHVVFLAQSGP